MRALVRAKWYVMTMHADEEMYDDGLTILDVERAILTGQIVERQRDQPREWKYLVRGTSFEKAPICVVAKIGPTEKLVIITVFRT
ncbi:MAG: DUF4258 domain-containing protein [Thermoanaerobaculia bacterium]|nr:DUF4258 domain-containing protein [Thermoanaerobaculia bacterium]